MSHSIPGAPGLDSQTWETSNLNGHCSPEAANAGCPTLAASLFLRLGWDAANPKLCCIGLADREAAQ